MIRGTLQEWKHDAASMGDGGILSIAVDFGVSTALDVTETFLVDPLRVGDATGQAVGEGAGAFDVGLAVVTDVGRGAAIAAGSGMVVKGVGKAARGVTRFDDLGEAATQGLRAAGQEFGSVSSSGRRALGAAADDAGSTLRGNIGVPTPGNGGLSPLSRGARAVLERPLEHVGNLRLPFRQPLTRGIRLQRSFVTATKSYPGVPSTRIGEFLKRAPLLRKIDWQQGHVFIQQRWFRPNGRTQWYASNDLANLGLRRVGNAGWNLMPMPRVMNRWLGRHPWASFGFGVGAAGSVAAAGYGGYQFGEFLNEEVFE